MKLIFGRLFEYAKLKVNMENAIFFLILPKQQYPNSVTSTLLQQLQFKINFSRCTKLDGQMKSSVLLTLLQ